MSRLGRFNHALRHRLGWEKGVGPFLSKELPPKTGWSATLGSLCVMLFGTMFVSGIFLAMYYNPSPDKAYEAIDYIMNGLPWGWLLRGLHHWGASAMVLAVFAHMMVSFFQGSYKKPREITWMSGIVMLLITLGLGFTGYLLPWDLKAYWATTVSTNIPKDIPLVGDWLSRVALGGSSISGATLTRFYAVHVILLPMLLVGFIAFHIYLVRAHGISEADSDKEAEEETATAKNAKARREDAKENTGRKYRFYPEHTLRSAIVFVVVFAVLIGLSIWGHIPREQVAGTIVEDYLPRPEWYYMWLFQLLTFFPGKWEAIGSLVLPGVLVVLLFVMPFLGKSKHVGIRNRALPLAGGVTFIVALVYLTMMGFAGAKPYGQTILIPTHPLTAPETRGLQLYVARECAYCHQIDGQGGHRVGPDMSNVARKGRTDEYLMKYIKDPKSVYSGSVMPKYDLPQQDLQALADFIQTLNTSDKWMRTITKEEALQYKNSE